MTFVNIPEEEKRKFLRIASRLSPENLSCDGELSKRETNRRYQECLKEWRELEKENGIKTSEDEVWNWWMSTRV